MRVVIILSMYVMGRGVRLWEVKNVVFVCIAGNITKCPLMRVVRLREVSVSAGGSTVQLREHRYPHSLIATYELFPQFK